MHGTMPHIACSALVETPKLDELPNTMMQYITVVSISLLLVHGCTDPGYRDVQPTELCMVAPHICGSCNGTCCMSPFWGLKF
jgi:hypothetical protein